jgi:hypothetical protein
LFLKELVKAPAGLDGRTGHRAIRTEHAAIARLRLKPLTASLAFVEELAGVRGHLLNGLMTAVGQVMVDSVIISIRIQARQIQIINTASN